MICQDRKFDSFVTLTITSVLAMDEVVVSIAGRKHWRMRYHVI
jgi:hypothetical protein